MRIAFVGKGGSGKTTLTALFSLLLKEKNIPTVVVDADVNMHVAPLLGYEVPSEDAHLSHPAVVERVKTYLRGNNQRIKELTHFRKTTPPGSGSRFVIAGDPTDQFLAEYAAGDTRLRLLVVGSYDVETAGASCYHNNLSIAENILSHLIDEGGAVVADMVAGVDAFANTLHAQFDLLVLAVEPTRRGVEVFRQYQELARGVGVADLLSVVGNKVRSKDDEDFLRAQIPEEKLIGFLNDSAYLRKKDQAGGALAITELESDNSILLEKILYKLQAMPDTSRVRLERLYKLHKKYVTQAFIRERFGDLTDQIDPGFSYEEITKKIWHKKEAN